MKVDRNTVARVFGSRYTNLKVGDQLVNLVERLQFVDSDFRLAMTDDRVMKHQRRE